MEEKYGINLELITAKFNERINQIKKTLTGIKEPKVEVKANSAQLEYIKQQIKEVSALLDYNQKKPFMNHNEVLKTEAELEKLTNQYNKLNSEQDELSSKSGNVFNGLGKSIEKSTNKIKRFGLALFGVRSIYSILSRASSAYMAQDTVLANKMQAVWTGLGSLLEPIISKIVNTLLKGVKYIAIFVKALTGVDLLAKATSKSLGGTNKSAKALSKTLSGFDELTNLDTEASGGATGIDTGWADAFNDVEIDTGWANKIQKFGEWVKLNWGTVLGLLGGTVGTIIAIKNGLGLIKSLGIGLIIMGVIQGIQDVISFIKDPSWSKFADILVDITLILSGVALVMAAVNAQNPVTWIILAITAVTALTAIIIKNWDNIKQIFSTVGQWFYEKVITPIGNFFKNMWEGIKNTFSNTWNWILNAFSRGGQLFNGLKDGVVNVFKTIVNSLISGINKIISTPFNLINNLLNKIRGIDVMGVKPFNSLWNYNPLPVPQIPKLNVGTNYVPEDQLAYIHKGEAVVPKKFNSQEYFGQGNDETNDLLERVIEAINNIEINPYTTIKEVGKASMNYINNKNRQLGRSVIA